MPRERKHAPVAATVGALAAKLDDMTLHDETRDPRDKGYMDAVRELRDWFAEHADDDPAGTARPGGRM
jgi:hypothetical protein